MDRLTTYLRYTCFCLILLLSSCVRDGQDLCPTVDPDEYYSYVRFIYDYNMAFEDLFHRQVSNIELYLFDENGIYIDKLTDRCLGEATFSKGYIMGLPEIYKEACQFVAFPGISNEHAFIHPMIPYQSTIDDLKLQLHEKESNIIDTSLKPLWHGSIAQAPVRARVSRNDTTTISLTKNTNKIRIVLQSTIDTRTFDINEFSFCLDAINNAYDAHNNSTSEVPWHYYPFYKENTESGISGVVELHTMRLFAGQKNQLTITHLPTSTTLISINLNTYLDALKLQEYTQLSLQEYMDREDQYKILIFMTPAPEEPGKMGINPVVH
ncbi:MAG: FimB/Mfa2 family fimbrial subunit [Bacteroides sp.]|nr:FimB/Mfa2 family fimbrial subunit [Bacteroides sp.]